MNLKEMAEVLNINRGAVVSVVGCGGKTTLIQKLSEFLSNEMKVGIAATTKMLIPKRGTYQDIFVRYHRECTSEVEGAGIYYFADEMLPSKLHGFGAYMTEQAKAYMDVIFIEADGSKGKRVKGWAGHEPVVIEDTTMTIGVITLKEIGMAATAENVHRMAEFEKLADIKCGEKIDETHICAMVNSPEGMFKNVKSRKILFINQIDSEEEYKQAIHFIDSHELMVDMIFIGSLKNKNVGIYKKYRKRKIAAVVLASGYGSRMGENKLLTCVDGKPMIEYTLDNVEKAGFFERYVVTAYDAVAALARQRYGISVVMNGQPELGQSRSIVLGTENCSEVCDGFMYFTGDTPALRIETIEKLLNVFEHYDKIIVPVYGRHRGNPVIFPKSFKEELLLLSGDVGGREIMRRHSGQLMLVSIEDMAQGMDIDTVWDLEQLTAKMHKKRSEDETT